MIIHFPLVLGTTLPIIALLVIWGLAKKRFPSKTWFVCVALAALFAGSSFAAVELGEREVKTVKKVVDHDFIHEHAEAAENVEWLSYVLLALSVVVLFVKPLWQQKVQILFFIVSLVAAGFLIRTGPLGAELVYKHDAGSAYLHKTKE